MAGYIVMQVSTPLVDTVGAQNKAEVIALVGDIFRGTDAPQLQIQYSANGTSWHATWVSGDIYLRTSADGGTTWSDAIRFIQDISTKADVTDMQNVEQVISAAINALVRENAALKEGVLHQLTVDNLNVVESLDVFKNTNLFIIADVAPTVPPTHVPQIYINTAAPAAYYAVGTTSVTHWKNF